MAFGGFIKGEAGPVWIAPALVVLVGQALGLHSEDMQGYKRTPNALDFLQHIRRQTSLEPGPAPGRIAVFRQSKFPCHVGIFSEMHGVTHIIHSYLGTTQVMEEPFIHHWPTLLVETRSYRDAA